MFNFRKILYIAIVLTGLSLLFALFFNADVCYGKKRKKGPVEIEAQVRDGFFIKGKLDIPPKTTVKNKVPLVVFLHSIGVDSNEWGHFPTRIKDELNVAVLTIDFRGHGASLLNKNSKRVYWQNFKESDYKKFPYDVIDVLKKIKEQYPEIDTGKTAIVGASLGANTALMTGSMGANPKTIVLLSPMLDYKGYDLRLPIVKYGNHPLLFMVSKKDKYPYESSLELIKFAQGKKQLKVYPKGGSGVALVKFQPDAAPLISDWIKDALGLVRQEPDLLKK